MLAKIGLLALAVLIASESFAVSAAILWPLAVLWHLSRTYQTGAFGVAALIGALAGGWMLKVATAPHPDV